MGGRSSPRSSLRHGGRNDALPGRTWAKEHLLLGGWVLPLIGRIATSDSRQLSASAGRSLHRIVSRKVPLPDSLEGQLPRAREPGGRLRAAYCPLKSPLLQAVRRWKGTRAGYGWFGGLPRAGKSRSSARKSGGVPLTARCAVSGQPVLRAWEIRSVTRPAVTWDVIELQPAHQNQGGHPELPKSVRAQAGHVHTPRHRSNPADARRDLDGDAG